MIRVEAFADPSPPVFTEEDLQQTRSGELNRLLRELEQYSEQELMDQVYRRFVFHLCRRCYEQWVEHPAG